MTEEKASVSVMDQKRPNQQVAEHHGDDLQEFIASAKLFFQRYGKWVSYLVVLMALGLVVGRWLATHRENERQEAYSALAAATSPLALEDVARAYDTVPGLAGVAYLKAGDMYLNQAVMGDESNDLAALLGGTPTVERTAEERESDLKSAVGAYNQVISLNESALQVLNARLGLAAAQESLGDFDGAREQYDKVVADAGERWGVITRRAKMRLASLKSVESPVQFAERAQPNLGEGLPGLDTGALPGGSIPGVPEPVLGNEGENGAEAATPQTPSAPESPAAPAPGGSGDSGAAPGGPGDSGAAQP